LQNETCQQSGAVRWVGTMREVSGLSVGWPRFGAWRSYRENCVQNLQLLLA